MVDFYWRPGCGWSSALERALLKQGVALRRHNIADDPDAAAFVRAHADGNETVPTVRVGDRTMVNPSAAEVVAALTADPSLPDPPGLVHRRGLSRLVERVLGA